LPVHAGVDFQVIADAALVTHRSRLHRPRGAWRGNRRREVAVEQAVEIADAHRAEDEDFGLDARAPQHRALFDVGACQQVGARSFERPGDLSGAVSVRVRFDDGDDARRVLRLLALQVIDDGGVVPAERLEIDACDGRANH
jgi:hypothetical protein